MSHARRQWPARLFEPYGVVRRAARLRLGRPARLHRWLAVVTWRPFMVLPRRPTNRPALGGVGRPPRNTSRMPSSLAFSQFHLPHLVRKLNFSQTALERLRNVFPYQLTSCSFGLAKQEKGKQTAAFSLSSPSPPRQTPNGRRGFERLHQIQQQSTLVPASRSCNAEVFVLTASLHSPHSVAVTNALICPQAIPLQSSPSIFSLVPIHNDSVARTRSGSGRVANIPPLQPAASPSN